LRNLLRLLLYKPLLFLVARFSSRPDREKVDRALSRLCSDIAGTPAKRGPAVDFDAGKGRFIIFSDQHKGAKDGADNFALAEPNYLAALHYYDQEGFHFISLGDNEELWENSLSDVKKHNQASFEAEKKFIDRNAFSKIFGNHDLYWDNDPFAPAQLKAIYQSDITIYEGIILRTNMNGSPFVIYCTHGHQGDAQSDGNWFSKFFVAQIWGPLESYLSINPNTPSCNDMLKTTHNQMMYEWSSTQKNLLLITGHTHQPVFESMTHLESLYRKLEEARKANNPDRVSAFEAEIELHGFAQWKYNETKPTYFNSGCCCFDDGDITGIEIDAGKIRLVKWDRKKSSEPTRIVLEESLLEDLAKRIT
jgi:hypothetical protein